jgi:alpha-ribazole phosphatase/probable phosphoglycerate mutase
MSSRREHPACRVVLVRHASANGQGRFLGQRDAPLSAVGRRQLPALVEKLKPYPVEAIYCSDLSRTRTTAAAVARRRGIVPDGRAQLREMHFGDWEGLSWDRVAERFPALAKRWVSGRSTVTVPGGEPMARFKARVTRELKRIVSAGPGRCVVVVTHAGVIRVALGAALGLDDRHLFRIAQPPCAVSVIDYFRGGVIVRCING